MYLLFIVTITLCWLDIRHRKLPNVWVLVLFLICLLINVQFNIGLNVLIGASVVFAVGVLLFVWRIVAAGDVKLLIAYSIAISADLMVPTLILMALLGGVVSSVLFLWAWKTSQIDQLKLRGVPYGVPIALAGFTGVMLSMYS